MKFLTWKALSFRMFYFFNRNRYKSFDSKFSAVSITLVGL